MAASLCQRKPADLLEISARSTRAYGALQNASGVRPFFAARLPAAQASPWKARPLREGWRSRHPEPAQGTAAILSAILLAAASAHAIPDIGGQIFHLKGTFMPKLTDREKLTELEQRKHKIPEEIEQTRMTLRGRYAAIVTELEVETLTEKEFRDLITLAIKTGSTASLQALKALPPRPS